MRDFDIKQTPGDTSWFLQDRFGMFIHFGLYSMPARHEWVKSVEKISEEQYDKYFKYFNPDKFDAKKWAAQAKKAGMKYAVMTAKHHEGFCLFDSAYTDYKSTNTPAKRDFIKEYTDAFREAGLKVGIYYSLIDWHHPDYQIDIFHPRRAEEWAEEANRTRSMERYREYLFNQVRELMTNYGKIDIIWFDFTYPNMDSIRNEYNQFAIRDYKEWMPWTTKETWDSEGLINMIRDINPDIIINDRLGISQDTVTPEQSITTRWPIDRETGKLAVWEACHTFSGSWGYYRDEMSWKSSEMLIRILIRTVSCGGNLIMNVGPTSRGNFDKRAEKALEAFSDWIDKNSRAIYDCSVADSDIVPPVGTLLTQSMDGKRLYIHLIEYPYSELDMENIADRIDYAQFLHDGSEIRYRKNQSGTVSFLIPSIKPNETVPVIEVFLK